MSKIRKRKQSKIHENILRTYWSEDISVSDTTVRSDSFCVGVHHESNGL